MFAHNITRAFGVLLVLTGVSAYGQGIIVDRRADTSAVPITGQYEIRQIAIDAQVRDQVASVQVTQEFYNPTPGTLEVEYLFPLPIDGAMRSMTLMVDGKEMPGQLLAADEARRIYESIVRARKDPALLEWMGQGLFKTSVFPVPAGKSCKLVLRYTQLLAREQDRVTFSYPLGTQKLSVKPVQLLSVRVTMDAKQPIKSIYSPTHAVTITRPGGRSAVATLEMRDVLPGGDFRLIYGVNDQQVGATLLSYRPDDSEDGYFLLLASPGLTRPEVKTPEKTVIFVIDKSGSMSGRKIVQARDAARFVLGTLNEGDRFNLIVYDDAVQAFKPELQMFNDKSRQEAMAFIDNIRDGGSTNINEALRTAMGMIRDDSRPAYILFLTDGLPTAGEQNEMKIAENVRNANGHRARLIAFGVGDDVNARLLDRLSHGNGGVSEFVKPGENLEGPVSRFASRLTAPVLANVKVTMDGTDINRAYPRDLGDLFEGGQIVWVGRYRGSTSGGGDVKVTINGTVNRETRRFTSDATLASASSGSAYEFVERLWAAKRIGELIDQIDLHGRNEELIHELTALSTRYGILTPYTSFLANEGVEFRATAANAATTGRNTDALSVVSGPSGTAQRKAKSDLQNAPQAPAASAPVVGMDTAGNKQVVQTIRNVGNRTFYQRGKVWMQSTVKEADEKNVKVVKQFSDEYFELTKNVRADEAQYLTFRETVTVQLNGQWYRIEPPEVVAP
ncbi:MAG: VIT domain-containing protein [Phycisphaerales bacterium]